jgi:predicted nucleotidyltransferase
MKKLLEDLQKSKLVKITGSYADGTQGEGSDIDFYVKEDHPEINTYGEKRNIEKVKDILDKHKIKVRSPEIEYWTTYDCGNKLNTNLEFSNMFNKRKNRLKEVYIMGVLFKTH